MFEGLHHAQLAMPRDQEETARTCYAGGFGMTEVDEPPVLAARGGAWFRAGGLELHLGVEDGFGPAREAHPGIQVGDLDEVVRRLAAAGPQVAWDADSPGYRRVYAQDPDELRLEFRQPGRARGGGGPWRGSCCR